MKNQFHKFILTKNKFVYIVFLICISGFLFSSCPKSKCNAGTDGSLIIKASMVHHIKGIKGCTLRIKFCASELPGTNSSDFDMNVKGNDADTFVVISGLREGDYYFYGTGYDSSIVQNVQGGSSFSFSLTSDTLRPVIYVTE